MFNWNIFKNATKNPKVDLVQTMFFVSFVMQKTLKIVIFEPKSGRFWKILTGGIRQVIISRV